MADNQYVNLLLLKMKDHMTEICQTDIDESDVTRADVVKLGRLLDNKTRKNIQLGIMAGDPDNPEEMDAIATLQKLPDIGMTYPAREIGGGQIWMRRGIVRVECFFIKERLPEEEAYEKAYIVMGRAFNAVESLPITEIPRDSYGERGISVHAYASTYFESGGGPSSFIFRGKIFWACFTEKTKGFQFI